MKTADKKDNQPSSKPDTPVPPSLSQPIISIIVSSKDKILQAWDGDKKILQTSITIINPGKPLGTHLYTLTGIGPDGSNIHWSSIQLSKGNGKAGEHPARIIRRVQMSEQTSQEIVHFLHPGATFMITDRPLADETRSSNGFVIMTQK